MSEAEPWSYHVDGSPGPWPAPPPASCRNRPSAPAWARLPSS